jgi:hypothetical protein
MIAVKMDMPSDMLDSATVWTAAPVLAAEGGDAVFAGALFPLVFNPVAEGVVAGVVSALAAVDVIGTTEAISEAGIALPTPVSVH